MSPEWKVSACAGFLAGLVTFVIDVVSQLSMFHNPDFRVSTLAGLLARQHCAGLGAGLAAHFGTEGPRKPCPRAPSARILRLFPMEGPPLTSWEAQSPCLGI
jgi:hypothetical protein